MDNIIKINNELQIWKTNLNLNKLKNRFLNEAFHIINQCPNSTTDGFPYLFEVYDNENHFRIMQGFDIILKNGIDFCKNIHKDEWNKMHLISWVNRVQSKTPKQDISGDKKYHTHTEIHSKMNRFIPNYTFVYYIQMPDIMNDTDGLLYFKDNDNVEYSIMPQEGDLIIMPASVPHYPTNAPNANIDRIVLAASVGFEMLKTTKTLF